MKKFRHHYYNSLLKEADSKEGTVSDIQLSDTYLRELPDFIKDLHVRWSFDVSQNSLTSCKNFPKSMGRGGYISENKITSLEGLQRLPDLRFDMYDNKLTSVEPLSNLPSPRCKQIILDFNKLTSCKGLENITCAKLVLSHNEISSWEYIPDDISEIYVGNNKLTSWKGMPDGVDRLYMQNNWDVVDFNDYKEVRVSLWISSSRWTSLESEKIYKYMESKGITPPFVIEPIN